MFQDEARFGRLSDPRRRWAPPGVRPEVQAAMVREYVYAYAAVSPGDGVLDSLIMPEVNTLCTNLFLVEVARRHPDECIVMALDGAGWHRALELRIPQHMRLISLPPYSPELNPVEHIWDELRGKWFHNRVFDSLDAVEDLLCSGLRTLETNPTGFTP